MLNFFLMLFSELLKVQAIYIVHLLSFFSATQVKGVYFKVSTSPFAGVLCLMSQVLLETPSQILHDFYRKDFENDCASTIITFFLSCVVYNCYNFY
jgi:hypothetical protein